MRRESSPTVSNGDEDRDQTATETNRPKPFAPPPAAVPTGAPPAPPAAPEPDEEEEDDDALLRAALQKALEKKQTSRAKKLFALLVDDGEKDAKEEKLGTVLSIVRPAKEAK